MGEEEDDDLSLQTDLTVFYDYFFFPAPALKSELMRQAVVSAPVRGHSMPPPFCTRLHQ